MPTWVGTGFSFTGMVIPIVFLHERFSVEHRCELRILDSTSTATIHVGWKYTMHPPLRWRNDYAILDFKYDEKEEERKFRRDVCLKDQDGDIFYDKLHFKFLQFLFDLLTIKDDGHRADGYSRGTY